MVVFNNVLGRLRRMSPSIEDASMDLGANALQTFRSILLPGLRTALVTVEPDGLTAMAGSQSL